MTATGTTRTSLVLGLGLTGTSCVRWLLARGDRVIAMDTRERPPGLAAITALRDELSSGGAADALTVVTGGFRQEVLAQVDLVVASPGIPLDHPFIGAATASGLEVLGDVELFARERTGRVAAITGTNGKSTVTALVARMLEAAGMGRVAAGGNIGRPVLELLDLAQAPDVAVLELSSFQLERTASLAPPRPARGDRKSTV